ncbi:MAG: chitobiase/beta-hexosaminidase C-terminal domain-containing protein, partial [Muribaculaceae bacterium]|nr:chitobiase/beta-hexosaminidase C-terminal domain-containing protein [Muribaculaceae bacterium]
MSTVPTTAAAVGGYVFGLNSSASDASTTFYYSHATYDSSAGAAGENNGTNGSGTITAPYISEKACAVDEAGHFLFGKPYNSGRGIRWVYVFQPASNGKTMTYLGAITLSKDGTDYTGSYANNSEGECLAITASGDVTKEGGKIYLCPKGKNYMYRFTCAGGYTTVKTVTKYTYSPSSVKNGDYASFRWYATDTGLLNASNNGVTDKNGCYKCVFSGSTATLTDFDGNSGTVVSGNSWRQGAYNCGATAFKIRGHLILVGAVNELEADPKKSMAFWDVTDGDPSAARRIIDYATMGSWPSAPYMWQNAIKASDDQWDVYTYFKTGRSACYKVSASAATVSAPTVSLAAGTYNNNQTCTITWTSSITVNGKSLGVTLHYSTDNGSTYSTATGGSKAITISKTCTLKAYCQLTSYDNKSSTVSRAYTMKCATPTFSTSGGGTSPTTVTITSATSGATIYYTTDGTTPTTSSNTYNGAFTCSTVGTVTIKAIAVKSNYSNSEVGQTTVTYNPVLSAPTISPTSNTYNNDLTATITAASGATIYYRVNGGSWQTYSSGVSVTANNTTVEAYASMTNYTDSPIASQTYNLKCALPTLSVGGGTYTAPQTVTITSATDGATIYYSTGSGFNTLANGGSITISESCSLSVYATKANYQDSEFYMTSYTINATPDGSVSNLALAYSPVIGKSANNPTADLIRFDETVSFTAAPATSNGWTLDKYVVTITDGTHYAQNVSGANFNALVMNADVTTIAAQNFKVGSTYTVSIAARYVKSGEEPYDVTAATSSVKLDEYATYSPSMSVKTFVQPSQEQSVWWGGESHKCYFDVYRVELSINNAEAVSTIPVSYYQLQVSKDNGTTWENVVDRTIDNLLDPSDNPATTYPAISGATSANRFPGNYNFN